MKLEPTNEEVSALLKENAVRYFKDGRKGSFQLTDEGHARIAEMRGAAETPDAQRAYVQRAPCKRSVAPWILGLALGALLTLLLMFAALSASPN